MKIALVRKTFGEYGGAERYVLALAKELKEAGAKVHIFANKWDAQIPGLKFYKVPVVGGLSFLKVLSFALFSYLMLKKEKFDIVHSFERTLLQDVYRAGDGCHKEWLRQRYGKKWSLRRIASLLNPLHILILYLERKIFEREDRAKIIIANSSYVRDSIMLHYGVSPERIRVIYNGVDLERFNSMRLSSLRIEVRKRYGFDDDKVILLFVGTGFERKGLRYAIESLSKIQDSRVKLVVVGKGNPPRYEKIAIRLGVFENVLFLGTSTDVQGLYAGSDIFVLPSLYDPFSNVCLEAMACGLPVITSLTNGASEIIADNESGFVLKDSRNPDEIAGKIKVLMDKEKRISFGKKSREIATRFPVSRNVAETMKVHQEIVLRHRKRENYAGNY